jgi:hypothetical protein
MPVYRVTDTATDEQFYFDEPTDWDAWMHFKMFVNPYRPADRCRSLEGRFDAKAELGGHHIAVERLALGGAVVEGTYITFIPSDPTAR